jgi:hypothetical protein
MNCCDPSHVPYENGSDCGRRHSFDSDSDYDSDYWQLDHDIGESGSTCPGKPYYAVNTTQTLVDSNQSAVKNSTRGKTSGTVAIPEESRNNCMYTTGKAFDVANVTEGCKVSAPTGGTVNNNSYGQQAGSAGTPEGKTEDCKVSAPTGGTVHNNSNEQPAGAASTPEGKTEDCKVSAPTGGTVNNYRNVRPAGSAGTLEAKTVYDNTWCQEVKKRNGVIEWTF